MKRTSGQYPSRKAKPGTDENTLAAWMSRQQAAHVREGGAGYPKPRAEQLEAVPGWKWRVGLARVCWEVRFGELQARPPRYRPLITRSPRDRTFQDDLCPPSI